MNTYKFYYGANEVYTEISDKVNLLKNNVNILYAPCLDMKRSILYGDPCPGVLKNVKILNIVFNEETILKCNECAYVLPLNHKVYVIKCLDDFIDIINYVTPEEIAQHKLDFIHSNLKLKYLNYGEYWLFQEEYPEQLLSARYIKGNERILEIGGNIGRNSLVISYILKNSRLMHNENNLLVTLECNCEIAKHLKVNKDINSLDFFVEEFAISNKKLIQKDWEVHEFDHDLLDLPTGFSVVPTIDLHYLRKKYGFFDTLILDCEGSFYGILKNFPEILDGINLIIMENDYHDIQNKIFIDSVLFKHNFYVKYEEKGGWGPCKEFFYQVWDRKKML